MKWMAAIWAPFLIACATGTLASVDDDAGDAGSSATTESTCADIDVVAACHACSGASCQPNGCYGGYVCDTVTMRCKAPSACP